MRLTIDIDETVYERLAERARRQGFDSPEEYGAVVVSTVIDELEDPGDEAVRDRLEDLGYL